MSLRIFHVIFIVVCLLLCLFVGGWGIQQYLSAQSTSGLAVGATFLLCGVVLIVYGSKTFQKLKDLS